MTAVVGILNKKAVAIAADSAVTMSNGKIFNRANKIFTLSKFRPVGIMIYSSAEFMSTPWETIIKMYRNSLKDKPFDTLIEYKDDFIKFIHDNNFFCSEEHQKITLQIFLTRMNKILVGLLSEKVQTDLDKMDNANFLIELEAILNDEIAEAKTNTNYQKEFQTLSEAEFDKYLEPLINEIIEHSFVDRLKQGLDDERKKLLRRYYYHIIKIRYENSPSTGLVFTGFGEKEIFPSINAIRVTFGFNKLLRYYEEPEKGGAITHDNVSEIQAFAQYDVIHTILTGVDPDLRQTYVLNFQKFLNEYDDLLLKNFTGDKVELEKLIKKIDKGKVVEDLRTIMADVIQNRFVTPLHEAISGLSKEDLAEMAESLIYLTYLKRRITNAEESVGGPVDVAIISKGDGFIWIKRKHYFNADLNNHFLKNYLKY